MCGHAREHRLHIFWQAIATTIEHRAGTRRVEQRQTRARREADANVGMRTARCEQCLYIVDQGGAGEHCVHCRADLLNLRRRDAWLQVGEQFAAVARRQQCALGFAIRVIQADAQHETVELRVGQWIRAGQFDWILRGDDEKRRGQRIGLAISGDLLFRHRFEQGALRFRRGAIDFIGKHELREQRARMEFERAALALVDADADNVGGQQIGSELDALEGEVQRGGQRMRERGFADSGQVLDQQVAAGQEAGEREAYLGGLAEYDAVDLLLRQFQRGGKGRVERRWRGGDRGEADSHDVDSMRASIGNLKPAGVPLHTDRTNAWRTAFWIVWAVALLAKIILAHALAPFGDEAWYWQESRHLAAGYSDLPPATAWLIALGETLFGHGMLAMRTPFLVLGALLPLIVVRIARRGFDDDVGWRAGLLALGLPLAGTLGIFALPDVPLTCAAALALDAAECAARTQRMRDFALLGLALALAWLAHYRAAMLLLAGVVFFVATPRGHTLLRTPGPWLALAISTLGLLPILWFNAQHDWAGLRFQLADRHPWSFHGDALVQPLEQALVCTPLFYLLLLWAAWQCRRRTREDPPWDLFAVCAGVPIVLYFVVGLFADATRFRAHWPLPGYLPLLIALPALVRESKLRRSIVVAYATLALGTLVAFAYLTAAAVPGGAVALARVKAFPEHFVGWNEAAEKTRELLAPSFADRVLVADNFMLAAELDFAFDGQRPVYALDQPINAKHGRALQLGLWRRDEAALKTLGPREVLLVAEPTARRERERADWMLSLCARVAELEPIANLDLYDGRKRYRWYEGTVAGTDAANTPCAPALTTP